MLKETYWIVIDSTGKRVCDIGFMPYEYAVYEMESELWWNELDYSIIPYEGQIRGRMRKINLILPNLFFYNPVLPTPPVRSVLSNGFVSSFPAV